MTAPDSAELLALATRAGRRQRRQLQHPVLPAQPARRARSSAGGEVGDVRLVTGRYFQDWLLLETDWNWRLAAGPRRGAAGGRRHRLALAGPDELRHRSAGRRGDGRPGDVHPDPPRADRPGRDVLDRTVRRDRGAPHRRPRTPPRSCSASTNGARGVMQRQPDQRRPQELARRGRSTGRAGPSRGTREQPDQLWLGHRDRPNELLLKNPALMHPVGQRRGVLPAGHVEGFADTFARPLPGRLRRHRGRRALGAPDLPDVRRRPRRDARRRGDRRQRARGSLGRRRARSDRVPAARPRRRRTPSRSLGGAAMKLGLLTAPFPETPLDDVVEWTAANGFESIEIACWPRTDRADPALRRHVHIDVANLSRRAGDATSPPRSQAKGLHISGLGFYPNPLHPDPGAPGRGHRPPAARDHGRREDGRPVREHVHGRRRRQDPGRELGATRSRSGRTSSRFAQDHGGRSPSRTAR